MENGPDGGIIFTTLNLNSLIDRVAIHWAFTSMILGPTHSESQHGQEHGSSPYQPLPRSPICPSLHTANTIPCPDGCSLTFLVRFLEPAHSKLTSDLAGTGSSIAGLLLDAYCDSSASRAAFLSPRPTTPGLWPRTSLVGCSYHYQGSCQCTPGEGYAISPDSTPV